MLRINKDSSDIQHVSFQKKECAADNKAIFRSDCFLICIYFIFNLQHLDI